MGLYWEGVSYQANSQDSGLCPAPGPRDDCPWLHWATVEACPLTGLVQCKLRSCMQFGAALGYFPTYHVLCGLGLSCSFRAKLKRNKTDR